MKWKNKLEVQVELCENNLAVVHDIAFFVWFHYKLPNKSSWD